MFVPAVGMSTVTPPLTVIPVTGLPPAVRPRLPPLAANVNC